MHEPVIHTPNAQDFVKLRGRVRMEVFRDGKHLSTDFIHNLIVQVGREHALDAMFGLKTAAGTWYCSPLGSGTPADNWTMTEAGGNEFTDTQEAARQAWTGVRTGTTITNTVSKAKYTISGADRTITGVFLNDEGTKGASLGTLVGAANFSTPRTGLQNNDEVYLTYEVSSTP